MDGGDLKTLNRRHGGDLKTLSRQHGGIFGFHRHSRWLYSQQQSSSSSSNRFIEHDVSTRKLGPSSGIRPSFLNRSIYTFLLLCLGVATHRLKLF